MSQGWRVLSLFVLAFSQAVGVSPSILVYTVQKGVPVDVSGKAYTQFYQTEAPSPPSTLAGCEAVAFGSIGAQIASAGIQAVGLSDGVCVLYLDHSPQGPVQVNGWSLSTGDGTGPVEGVGAGVGEVIYGESCFNSSVPQCVMPVAGAVSSLSPGIFGAIPECGVSRVDSFMVPGTMQDTTCILFAMEYARRLRHSAVEVVAFLNGRSAIFGGSPFCQVFVVPADLSVRDQLATDKVQNLAFQFTEPLLGTTITSVTKTKQSSQNSAKYRDILMPQSQPGIGNANTAYNGTHCLYPKNGVPDCTLPADKDTEAVSSKRTPDQGEFVHTPGRCVSDEYEYYSYLSYPYINTTVECVAQAMEVAAATYRAEASVQLAIVDTMRVVGVEMYSHDDTAGCLVLIANATLGTYEGVAVSDFWKGTSVPHASYGTAASAYTCVFGVMCFEPYLWPSITDPLPCTLPEKASQPTLLSVVPVQEPVPEGSTDAPPTDVPPTSAPPTPAPPTAVPTHAPPTPSPPTRVPSAAPATAAPPTPAPDTATPPTEAPPTAAPPTPAPLTLQPAVAVTELVDTACSCTDSIHGAFQWLCAPVNSTNGREMCYGVKARDICEFGYMKCVNPNVTEPAPMPVESPGERCGCTGYAATPPAQTTDEVLCKAYGEGMCMLPFENGTCEDASSYSVCTNELVVRVTLSSAGSILLNSIATALASLFGCDNDAIQVLTSCPRAACPNGHCAASLRDRKADGCLSFTSIGQTDLTANHTPTPLPGGTTQTAHLYYLDFDVLMEEPRRSAAIARFFDVIHNPFDNTKFNLSDAAVEDREMLQAQFVAMVLPPIVRSLQFPGRVYNHNGDDAGWWDGNIWWVTVVCSITLLVGAGVVGKRVHFSDMVDSLASRVSSTRPKLKRGMEGATRSHTGKRGKRRRHQSEMSVDEEELSVDAVPYTQMETFTPVKKQMATLIQPRRPGASSSGSSTSSEPEMAI